MSIGVLLAVLSFALSYADAPLALHPRVRHSSVVRNFEERAILSANQDKVCKSVSILINPSVSLWAGTRSPSTTPFIPHRW